MGAESPSSPPLRDKMMRSSDIIAKDGINYDPKKKQYCSIPEASRPCYALSGLQRLLKTFRKADQQEEPKIVGLSIVIENSWSYSCWKDQLKSVSVSGHTMGSPAKIASSCKTSPQIVSKSSLAAQCKDRETNGGSEHRSSVLLFPPTVVYSNVVASTPLPAIDFLDSCYLCKRSLGPGLDIYMYRGDKAFCSVECRSKQIAMDEQREISSSAALKPSVTTTAPRDRRSAKNRTHIAHGRELTTAA